MTSTVVKSKIRIIDSISAEFMIQEERYGRIDITKNIRSSVTGRLLGLEYGPGYFTPEQLRGVAAFIESNAT